MKLYAEGRSRSAGFSLIEVIVVLTLLAVMSAIVFSRGGGSNVRLVAETGKLSSHLRFAQSLGLANNLDDWQVVITKAGYSLERNNEVSPVPLPGTDSADYRFPGNISVEDGTGKVGFDEFGRPVSGGASITLTDGNNRTTITIEPETGHQS
jgi:prepilin-type N-terminal cleavage/methylation domain-containing protein